MDSLKQLAFIKHLWRDLSLRKSIMLYIAAFVVLAIGLSVATAAFCNQTENKIRQAYPVVGEKYYLTTENGQRLGEGTYIFKETIPFQRKDELFINVLELAPTVATPIYSALCIIAAAFLFYRNKLKKPLATLRAASEKIADNDLNFTIVTDNKDELGQLCASFELMRATLAKQLSAMWQQVEERKQLNAAFAHELRTPLTVLKGYDEMLQQSADVQTKEIAITMGKHIARLETYVDSMSRLRRLEDAQPVYQTVVLQPFLLSLQESAQMVCTQYGKRLALHNTVTIAQSKLDPALIAQVCNNLTGNAARYARVVVTLSFAWQDNGLLLIVKDDGSGFSQKALRQALQPYFTEADDHAAHFGLGLSICQMLCRQHGGYCAIANDGQQGAVATAFFPTMI